MRRTTRRVGVALAGALIAGTGGAAASPAAPESMTVPDAPAETSTAQPSPPAGEESDADDAGSGPGIAGRCGDTRTAEIDGATAKWALHCSSPPNINKVTGWVKDTRFDARAASLKFTDEGAILLRHYQARGSGETTSFSFEPSPHMPVVEGRLQLRW